MSGIEDNIFENTTRSFGFFKEYYQELRKKIKDDEINTFASLKTDEDRLVFVNKLVLINGTLLVNMNNNCKETHEAILLKERGNKEFSRGNHKEALKLYTDAILKVPAAGSDLGVIIANRSAALYHLELYEAALIDVQLALDAGYPRELHYKVLERKARCLLAQQNHDKALAAFKSTIQALDYCKLATDKKLKLQTDIQIMLGILTKPLTKNGRLNAFVPGKPEKTKNGNRGAPELSGKRNTIYDSGSDKFEILENETVGRYAAAAKDIQAGDILLLEQSYCSVLLAEYAKTNCQHCFKRTTVPYPCPSCVFVVFCSIECRIKAQNSYHKYECNIWDTLFKSGASVMVLLALRIITQQPLSYFWNMRSRLQEPNTIPSKYSSSDYMCVHNLVRHQHQRSCEDFLERTVMAKFLLDCLVTVGYFQESDPTTAEEQKVFIGGLILRSLQSLQFNCHEVSELETVCIETIDKAEAKFIGGGLFPTLSLFNHSCDPGVVRYFLGNSVVVRAVKPIRQGEPVAENYGPIFTLNKRDQRHAKLKKQYWFQCNCVACFEDWPTFQDMDRTVLRFRCDARKDGGERHSSCRNAVAVPLDTTQFMAQCLLCGQHTNILKGLKTLQDTDVMFRQASVDTDKGNYKVALEIYLQILTLLDKHLVPPFPDYHLCQQAIRKCMLSMGNRYLKDTL